MGDNCPISEPSQRRAEPPGCKLKPSSKYGFDGESKQEVATAKTCIDHSTNKPIPCPECRPWQKYFIYAIPFLFYIPWAIRTMRCKPKCCPPVYCCPKINCPPRQNTCCEPMPAKGVECHQPKKQEDFKCGHEKKACDDD